MVGFPRSNQTTTNDLAPACTPAALIVRVLAGYKQAARLRTILV
jgi:hypothetical protein